MQKPAFSGGLLLLLSLLHFDGGEPDILERFIFVAFSVGWADL
jgi:hypothetical protein